MKLESLYLSLILSHQKEVSFQPTSITSRNSSQIVENLLQLFEVVFHSGFDLGAPFLLHLNSSANLVGKLAKLPCIFKIITTTK